MNRNHPASPWPDRLRRGLLSLLLGGLPAFAGSGLAILLGGGVLGCSGASPDHCVLHADCPADEACLAGRCTPGCRRDDQCGAGQSCDAQARCVPAGEGEGEGEGLGEGEGEGEPDGGPPEDAGEQPDGGGSGLCRSELDGRVTRAEFTLGPGIGAPFVTLTPADRRVLIPVDLAGTPGPTAGRRVWTFDDPPATNRQPEYVQAWSPAAVPAGRHFPDATYVVRLSGEADLLAFFQLTADALLLLGLADPAAATTLLVYTPAVVALRFPVVPGESWETTATATGTLLGAQVEVVDRYQTHVLVAGDLQLDLGRLPVVQLATLLTRTFPAAGFSQSTTTVQFLGECGGFYATAVGPATGERLPAGVRQLQLLGSPLCRSAADCGAGGRCSASGLCQPDGIAPAGVAPACTANGDGVIADDEFVARPGLAALYLASPPDEAVAVDLAGAPAGGAAQSWDLRSAAFGSTEVVESLLDPTESWYASSFPEATYASLLDRSSGTLAVFRREPGRLLLLGLASQQRDLTLLVYEEPVEAFRFPLRVGDRWSAETRTTGTLGGFPTSLTIRYHFTVDAAGTVRLPAGDVPVLRQRLESVQQVEGAAYAISRRTVLFVAECLGAVARVLSPINEPAEDFSPATEVVRLTVPRCFGDLQCPDGTRCEQGRCLDREGRPWGEGTEGEGEEGEGEGTEGEGEGTEGEGEGAEGEGAEGEGAEGEGAEGEGAEGEGEGEGAEGEGEGAEGEGEGEPPRCNPLGDGVITREEVLFAPGLSAQFLLNDGSEGLIPVDLQGVPCPAGRCWDFSAAQAGDVGAPVAMLPVAGAWYAEDFPDASYATVLDREQGWLGLFQLTDAGLFLLGSASERADVMQTAYSPPVELYRFPLQPGSTWVSTSSGSGYWGWSPVLTTDTYTVRVAAAGEVTTPAGRFRALQVITHVEQEIPFTWFGSSQIVHTFFSECNGIVARVVSEDGEEDELFGRAAALERLAGQD